MSKKIKVGIIGGAGYTAGELLRLLVNHPDVSIVFVHSASHPDVSVSSVHQGLEGECDIKFTDKIDLSLIDCLFMCSGHGASEKFWREHSRPDRLKVIDLAQDFRDEHDGYVYGLPEYNKHIISETVSIANPGCFATAIQLSLLPLADAGKLDGEITITGITGSTGAGVKPGATTHFSWRSGNLSVYKPFVHQHLIEISHTLGKFTENGNYNLSFIPVRGDFPRGIFIMTTFKSDDTRERILQLYKNYYDASPFVVVSDGEINLKQVVNTNKAIIGVDAHEGSVLITCAIDNLLKGASGQAVQNMNIMFGLDETTGLKLKSLAF